MAFSALTPKRHRQPSPTLAAAGAVISGSGIVPPLPMTPPDQDGGGPVNPETAPPSADTALHVVSTELSALANLQQIYASDTIARGSIERAVLQISGTIRVGGKVVLSGVGKSGLIAKKVVASMNSVGIHSSFLHPTEALHGDLGTVRQNDTVLFITFSGKTPELMMLLPHLPPAVSIIAITGHRTPAACPLLVEANRSNTILLPAPIHETEATSFGLPAPMTSTTVALAISDALTLATARKLYPHERSELLDVFRQYHPGGAIGAAFSFSSATPSSGSSSMTDISIQPVDRGVTSPRTTAGRAIEGLATPVSAIPMAPTPDSSPTASSTYRMADILQTVASHPLARGWVHISSSRIIPPRRLAVLARKADLDSQIDNVADDTSIAVDKEEWVRISRSTPLETVRQVLRPSIGASSCSQEEDTELEVSHKHRYNENTKVPGSRVIAAVGDSDEVLGVVEEEDVWS